MNVEAFARSVAELLGWGQEPDGSWSRPTATFSMATGESTPGETERAGEDEIFELVLAECKLRFEPLTMRIPSEPAETSTDPRVNSAT